jgi:hypothetical protein
LIYLAISTPQSRVQSTVLLLLSISRVSMLVSWCIFATAMAKPIPKSFDDWSKIVYLFDELEPTAVSQRSDLTAYSMVAIISILNVHGLRLLPWRRTSFTGLRFGFPNRFVLRTCLVGSVGAHLLACAAGVYLAAQLDRTAVPYAYSVCFALVSLINAFLIVYKACVYAYSSRFNAIKQVASRHGNSFYPSVTATVSGLASYGDNTNDDHPDFDGSQDIDFDYSSYNAYSSSRADSVAAITPVSDEEVAVFSAAALARMSSFIPTVEPGTKQVEQIRDCGYSRELTDRLIVHKWLLLLRYDHEEVRAAITEAGGGYLSDNGDLLGTDDFSLRELAAVFAIFPNDNDNVDSDDDGYILAGSRRRLHVRLCRMLSLRKAGLLRGASVDHPAYDGDFGKFPPVCYRIDIHTDTQVDDNMASTSPLHSDAHNTSHREDNMKFASTMFGPKISPFLSSSTHQHQKGNI